MARAVDRHVVQQHVAWGAATTLLAGGLAGAAFTSRLGPLGPMLLVAAAVTVALAVTGRWIVASTTVLVVATALVPIYWSVPPGGLVLIAVTPAVLLAVLVTPFAVMRWGPVEFHALDWLVLLLVVTQVATHFANFDSPVQLSLGSVTHVGLLYLTVRLFAGDRRRLVILTIATAASGALLGFVGLYERVFEYSWFLEVREPGYLAEVWARYYYRYEEVRAAGSFAQPLPFAFFLALCLVLLAALASEADKVSHKALCALGAVGCVAGLWASQTRAPIGVAVIGYALYLLAGRQIKWWRQVVAPGLVVVAAAALTPLGGQIGRLWASTFSGTGEDAAVAGNTQYRGSLIDALGFSRNYSVWGTSRGGLFNQTGAEGVRGSIDNEFLLRLLQYGVTGLGLFLLIGFVVLWITFRTADPLARAWAAAATATFLGLSVVALLVQQADFFWMAVAVAGASLAARRQQDSGTRNSAPLSLRSHGALLAEAVATT